MIDALAVVGMAAVPVGELRFAVPWAMIHFGFPWYQAFVLALIGNLIPVLILPGLLQRLGYLLLKAPKPLGSVVQWRIERLKGGGRDLGGKVRTMGVGPLRGDAAALHRRLDGLSAGVGDGRSPQEVYADVGTGRSDSGDFGDDANGVGSFDKRVSG